MCLLFELKFYVILGYFKELGVINAETAAKALEEGKPKAKEEQELEDKFLSTIKRGEESGEESEGKYASDSENESHNSMGEKGEEDVSE